MTSDTITSHGSIEGSKQALVKDLKNVVGDTDALLSNVAHAAADEVALARTKLEARMTQAKSRLIDASLAVSGSARGAADATDVFVKENPWKMLGVAAAAGLVVGAILSRR